MSTTGRILYSYGDTQQLFGLFAFCGSLAFDFWFFFYSSITVTVSCFCFLCYVTISIKHIEARI